MEIVKIKQYTSVKKFYDYYTIKDGDKYLIDDDCVHYLSSKEECEDIIKKGVELGIPHSNSTELDVFEVNGILGVYDWNLNCLNSYYDIWGIVADYQDEENRFSNFIFPEKDNNQNDYDGDYDIPDIGPNYYDPRYDGPYHYIPPGDR